MNYKKSFFVTFVSGPKVCKRGRCGRGECVLTSTPPFFECKCKHPFTPPHCRTCKEVFFSPNKDRNSLLHNCCYSSQKQTHTVYCFSPKIHCVSLIHVGMVANAS